MGLAQRLRRAGNGGPAQVNDAVQIEQRHVVGGVERVGAAPRLALGRGL
jgi:hypothetical protein